MQQTYTTAAWCPRGCPRRVLHRLGDDLVVVAGRQAERHRARKRRGVGLYLEVALVHPPVADVDHEDAEQDEHRETDHDEDQRHALLVADAPAEGLEAIGHGTQPVGPV